jgi:glycine/D-amino acid oxidase-like deaminating enzyme/nitrite reductase/ring-hydroxylating ferredoxin subunit
MATTARPEPPRLHEFIHADVCVIGAGIAGLTTAYLLLREGKTVVVLDAAGPIGSGQTQRTTAHLSNAIDDRYTEIERLRGEDAARLAAESHTAAIDRIEAIATAEQIDCDFERLDGYLFAPPVQSKDGLHQEQAAAHRAGLTGVQRLPRAPLASFDTGPCLRFPRQGQFDPLKYLVGLAAAIHRGGGRIFAQTKVTRVTDGKPAEVEVADGHKVTACAVVVATNAPINDWVAIHTKQAPYRTYVIAALVPRGTVTKGLYWDTLDPYHYVRVQAGSDGDWLLVGGEDHKTGQTHDQVQRYARLEFWARERFPMMGPVGHRWSGQVMETIDGLAFIGRNPGDERIYVATGDSGMGMTHGTIAGILLTDLILGRDNPWKSLYDPSRKPLRAAGDFLSENLNVARQYGEWLTSGDVESLEDVPRDSGAVIRHGLAKVAVYRGDDGRVHEFSAVCPHLGCIVSWNEAEKTWDCPCHGSRFDCEGHVLNGPANRDLEPVTEKMAVK